MAAVIQYHGLASAPGNHLRMFSAAVLILCPMNSQNRTSDPGESIGALTPAMAAELSAPRGLQVTAVGSHDTASAVVAVPMTTPDAAYISCGTWGLVGLELEHPVMTDASREANFTNEGGVVMPIILEFTFADGTTDLVRIPAEVWRYDPRNVTWTYVTDRQVVSVELDPLRETADADRTDNYYPPRIEPTRLELYRSSSNPSSMMDDMDQRVTHAAITEHKHLSAALEHIKAQGAETIIVVWGVAAGQEADCGQSGYSAVGYQQQAATYANAMVIGANAVGERPYGRFRPSVYCGYSGVVAANGSVLGSVGAEAGVFLFDVPVPVD